MTDSRSSSPYPPPAQVQHQDSLASARDYDDAPNTDPDRDLRDVVDSGGMRVEEKIARAYHRDMSWRKVLVKLEPDAHNNMVVRRMFANAFGWPVIKHICDAHFSDSATARVRDDEELGVERAKRLGEAPDRYGAETTEEGVNIKGGAGVEAEDGKGVAKENGVPLVVVGSGKEISDGGGGSVDESRGRPAYRTDSEAREALDSVSDLPPSSATSAEAGGGGRPELRHSRSQDGASSRRDSVAWSEADWADSGDDSDDDVYHDHVAHGGAHGGAIKTTTLTAPDTGGSASEGTRSPSPSVWSWTEKIVGRGAMAARASSPRKTVPGETPGATAQGGGGPAPK